MRCGILCDKDGKVKRTWALISDTITVPVEDGDQVTEWAVDHGETTIDDPVARAALVHAAVEEQDRITTLKTFDGVLAHFKQRKHGMTTQKVNIIAPSTGPIYYGEGKGLHHRTVDAEGDVQERKVHLSNTLHAIVDDKKERVNG